MSACESKFVTQGCECLPHPTNDKGTVCAYIDREYGYIVPCNPECCSDRCTDKDLVPGIHVQISTGIAGAPPGVGDFIATSDLPTETRGAADFQPSERPSDKVWEIMVVPFILLIFALVVA